MRSLKNLVLYFCLVTSSLAFVGDKQQESKFLIVKPVVQNDFPNIFRPIGNWVKRLFKKKSNTIREYPNANVKRITLSQNNSVIGYSTGRISDNPVQKNICLKDSKIVDVLTKANEDERENDIFAYKYKISAGKIVGEGVKVVWDLSGVEPGAYTITAGVDDGCGDCGQTITMKICVIECSDCN